MRGGAPAAEHYEILGVKRTADAAEIKAAYRKLVKATHPDAGGNPALFTLVERAYATLSDPRKRADYDAELAGPPKAPQDPPPEPPPGPSYNDAAPGPGYFTYAPAPPPAAGRAAEPSTGSGKAAAAAAVRQLPGPWRMPSPRSGVLARYGAAGAGAYLAAHLAVTLREAFRGAPMPGVPAEYGYFARSGGFSWQALVPSPGSAVLHLLLAAAIAAVFVARRRHRPVPRFELLLLCLVAASAGAWPVSTLMLAALLLVPLRWWWRGLAYVTPPADPNCRWRHWSRDFSSAEIVAVGRACLRIKPSEQPARPEK